MSWKENKAVRLFTPSQELTEKKPDINDLLLLGQAALAHSAAAGHIVSSSGPLALTSSQPLPPTYIQTASAPSTTAAPSLPQHPVKLEVSQPQPPPIAAAPKPASTSPEAIDFKSKQPNAVTIQPAIVAKPADDLRALNERLSMPPPPPPGPVQRTAGSPPSGVSSTSEVAEAAAAGGSRKSVKASGPLVTNDRSDIGKNG